MSPPAQPSSRSPGQWLLAVFFGLLTVLFFFRSLQFASKWARRVVEGDANFKALTIWALVYVVVCGAITAVAWFLPHTDGAAPAQNGERGT